MADSVMAPPGVILSVFTDATGQPMVFFIDPLDPQRDKYIKVIHSAGGMVETDERALLNRNTLQLSSYPLEDRMVVSFAYIDESLKKGLASYADRFRMIPGIDKKRSMDPYDELDAADAVAQALAKKQKMSKSTIKFTPEADNYILEQVRLKPRFRTSHKFFEELAQHDLLKGHTGNSVRSRYRAHLEHKLLYVYKTDDFDNLVLDENGQRIAMPVGLAKTIKNRFSAEDDFHLCDDIINHVLNNQDPEQLKFSDGKFSADGHLNENKFSVLISFFDEYARHNPQHLSSSWRDRYRKFARVYGLQKYRDYYLQELKTKDGPQPMKNLTSRASKEKKKVENNVRRLKRAQDDADVAAAAAAAAVAANGHLLSHPHHHHLQHSQMDANAAAAVANMAVSARDASALDEEIGEVKNSNIHEALRNVGAEAGRVNIEDDIAIHPNLDGRGGDSDGDFELELKVEADSQDPYARDMMYLPRNATIDDIFNNNFYSLNPKEVFNLASNILSQLRPEDIGLIYEQFEELGLTKRLTGHLFKVTGANAKYMHDLLGQLLRGLEKDNDTQDLLFPRNRNGFWTPDYDSYLKRGLYLKLAFQDEESLRQRRNFLGIDE